MQRTWLQHSFFPNFDFLFSIFFLKSTAAPNPSRRTTGFESVFVPALCMIFRHTSLRFTPNAFGEGLTPRVGHSRRNYPPSAFRKRQTANGPPRAMQAKAYRLYFHTHANAFLRNRFLLILRQTPPRWHTRCWSSLLALSLSCQRAKTHLSSFQSLAHSLPKTPGCTLTPFPEPLPCARACARHKFPLPT